jgi:sugar/nucleoside kinase (ribokinase family)
MVPEPSRRADILVVGIATVDAIARPVREFPGPGGLQFFDQLTLTTGGCAVNVAIALAKLGVRCDLVTRIGADVLGELVLDELRKHGVPTDGVLRDAAQSTPFTFVAVGADGERRFLHTVGTNARICRGDVTADALAGRRFVHVAGTMLMDAMDGEPTADLLAAARATGATTLLDTVFVESATADAWRRRIGPALPHLDYFVPSFPEIRMLSGFDHPTAMARACQAAGARTVVIKHGAEGALLFESEGAETRVPPVPVERVVDATGAGDCWCAGFLAGLRDGLPSVDAARIGNVIAAQSIGAAGATTGVRAIDDFRAFLRQHGTRI